MANTAADTAVAMPDDQQNLPRPHVGKAVEAMSNKCLLTTAAACRNADTGVAAATASGSHD